MKTKNTILSLFLAISLLSAGLGSTPALAAPDAFLIHVPSDVSSIQQAISEIADGGVIEVASGTYTGRIDLGNLNKGFTLRGATGATVVLSGGNNQDVLRFQNKNLNNGRPVIFENLVIANGFTDKAGLGAGLTMYDAEATFINVTFRDNNAKSTSTVGGAAYVTENSTAFFINTTWQNNTSVFGGAALGIRSNARVYIHANQFLFNNAATSEHRPNEAAGGAISMGNSLMRISNSRFEANQAGSFGGAVYIIGSWSEPYSTIRADAIISNCTFISNRAQPHPNVAQNVVTEGGAINVEDQAVLKVYHSRFITNQAMIGGGLNNYRAQAFIYQSVFLGNQATGSSYTGAFGGSINATSADVPVDGSANRPTARLTVEDTLIQGRYNGVGTVAQTAGGIHISGDISRVDGDGTVPDQGSVTDNRAIASLTRVAIYDTDVQAVAGNSGVGGALLASLTDLTINDSLVLRSDALGDQASGGGVAVLNNSYAKISNLTAAANTSGRYGGAVFAQGSRLELRNSRLFENDVMPGIVEAEWESFGAAVFTSIDSGRNLGASGVIENNLISRNYGLPFFDDDRNSGPYNDVRYNTNQVYTSNNTYKNSLTSPLTTSALNSLVVIRSSAPSTDKSQTDNQGLGAAPEISALLAAPSISLPGGAAGDPVGPTSAYLSYAWSATSAKLDGTNLGETTGASATTQSSSHSLKAGNATSSASTSLGATPTGSFKATISQNSTQLDWQVSGGSYLDMALDQGVTYTTAPNGTAQYGSTLKRVYSFYTITKEGGLFLRFDTNKPTLWIAPKQQVLAGLNLAENKAYITIRNDGGSQFSWNASSSSAWAQVLTPSGQTQGESILVLKLNLSGKAPGTYLVDVTVNGGEAGTKTTQLEVIVVQKLQRAFLPMTSR